MSERIEDALKQMLVDRMVLKMNPAEIDESKSLMDDYGIDSVAVLEIIVGIEEKFGIVIEDGDFTLANFRTLTDIANYIRGKQV